MLYDMIREWGRKAVGQVDRRSLRGATYSEPGSDRARERERRADRYTYIYDEKQLQCCLLVLILVSSGGHSTMEEKLG